MTDQLLWESADDIGRFTLTAPLNAVRSPGRCNHIGSVLTKRPPAWTGA
ncbi:MAG: hypothetical protein ACRYF2_09065 [Janthinobacterium lividum]